LSFKRSFKFLVSSFKLGGDSIIQELRTRVSKPETRNHRLETYLILLLFGIAMSACQQKMAEQPRYDPLEASEFFGDGQSARPRVENTVARGELRDDEHFYAGGSGATPAATFPFPITLEVLQRGRERYDIYCSPCHSLTGDGDGMIPRRGFTRPVSFHIERLREAPPGYFFHIITQGLGAMPNYRAQIPPRDRWAIIAYVRALQLSRNASINDVPPEKRDELAGGQR
jgi:mono/diheme cytochrome c family protein